MSGDLCPLEPLGMPHCDRLALYEMDIDRDEKWIPLCIEHGPMYRRSSNVRIRTRRAAAGRERDIRHDRTEGETT